MTHQFWKTSISVALTAWLAIVTATAAPEPAVEELLDRALAKMSAHQSWSGDFKQSMSMMGGEMGFTGRMYFKQPQLTRMEMDMPMMGQAVKMLMVLDKDNWMWQQMDMPGVRQITKMNMVTVQSNLLARAGQKFDPVESMNPARQWEMTRQHYRYQRLPDTELNGQKMLVIEGVLKDEVTGNPQLVLPAKMFGKTRLAIGKNDGFVHKFEQFDKENKTVVMTMEFMNLKFGLDLADSLFVYQAPEGATVIDLTEMADRLQFGNMGMPGAMPPSAPPSPAP